MFGRASKNSLPESPPPHSYNPWKRTGTFLWQRLPATLSQEYFA